MCGRFSLFTEQSTICDEFGIDPIADLSPRYNIAPSQEILIVRANQQGNREGAMVRWGLVPTWMKEDDITQQLINARVETAFEKPSFRHAFKTHRCLVIADGFYEWQSIAGSRTKQPYYLSLPDHSSFAFAGLWERWHRDGKIIESCALLTTAANAQMQSIHHRMPIILSAKTYDRWIQPGETDVSELQAFITHVENPKLVMRPVSTTVNNPRVDGPECLE